MQMSRYRSLPEPRMYLVAFTLAALIVLFTYFQIVVTVDIIGSILLIMSTVMFILILIALLMSSYTYSLTEDRLNISYSVPLPFRRYHLGYLKSIIELSMLEAENLEARIEDLERSSGGKLRNHSHGDLVDCIVLFFKNGKKVDLVLISPKRKDIFLLDLRRMTFSGITMAGEMSYHELINELLKNDYRI
jgi:hypothetical protein